MTRFLFSFILFGLCLLSSCTDSMNVEPSESPQLVVYAFPSVNDTIVITVSTTKPMGSPSVSFARNAITVSCLTNGAKDNIVFADSINVDGVPVFTYRAIGNHRTGDRVKVVVETAGSTYASAWGETTIPTPPAINSVSLDTLFHKEDYYARLNVAFGKIDGVNHYAARIMGAKRVEDTDTVTCEWKEVETSLEPLLNGLTNSELDWGNNNDFYHRIYSFDAAQVASPMVKLRLCTLLQRSTIAYRVELCSLSTEYYNMLKSLNDRNNNDMGAHGLAFLQPTYTNIKGGYGCVAGYGSAFSEWMK